MSTDMDNVIDSLRDEAIARCRERVLKASKKEEKRAETPQCHARDYGLTFALRSRHAL